MQAEWLTAEAQGRREGKLDGLSGEGCLTLQQKTTLANQRGLKFQ